MLLPLGPEGPFLEMNLHGPLYADAKSDPQSQSERAKYKILPLLPLLWPHAAKSVTSSCLTLTDLAWREGEETPELGESFHLGFSYSSLFFTDNSTWPVKSVPSVKVTQHCRAAPWITTSGTQLKLVPPLAFPSRHSYIADHVSECTVQLLFRALAREEYIFCFLGCTGSALYWGAWVSFKRSSW